MSKKNYNINLQDSSYYISLNIIKKKQQQKQFDNKILFPPPPQSSVPPKRSSSTLSSTRPQCFFKQTTSPYDQLLTRNKTTIDKLRQRLKLVNEISNLNQKLNNNLFKKQHESNINTFGTNYYNYKIPKSNKFKIDITTIPINRKQPNLNTMNSLFKRSFSSTDDYNTNRGNKKSHFILPATKQFNQFMKTQFDSSFSLEKPSCLNETKDENDDQSLFSSIDLSSSTTLKSSSSLDIDKLSVNKFFKLDNGVREKNVSNYKSSEFMSKLLKSRKEFKPFNNYNNNNNNNNKNINHESGQMSSIRSMGSNELDLYIDSLIRQFRLKSKLNNNNCVNISNTATVTSSAEGHSTGADANTIEIIEDRELNSNDKTQAESDNDLTENEKQEDDDNDSSDKEEDEENSTFINYTHSYELEDISEGDSTDLSLVDPNEDLTFSNTNSSKKS